jgi:hypothetical protein
MEPGMITAAVWADIDGDKKPELWSPIVINRKIIPHDFDGKIGIENRYIYTNLNKCRFVWKLVSFPRPADQQTKPTIRAAAILPSFSLAPGEKGFLSLGLPLLWRQCDALYLTATDPHGREVFTWSWPIRLPKDVAMQEIWMGLFKAKQAAIDMKGESSVGEDGRIDTAREGNRFIVSCEGIRYFFDTTTGYLQNVINAKGGISLSGGPFQTGVSHALLQFNAYSTEEGFVVEPVYSGESYFQVKWIFSTGKPVRLEYGYTYGKHWSQADGADFMGIGFHYPEEKITGMKWLGRGPYRVWKNRMKGQSFGVWHKDYNNTITGAGWQYPEFKGYHADLYWVVIENKESPFTVYTDDQSIFLQMLRPDHSKYEHESIRAAFPESDIGFMTAISPVGTRSQIPGLLGPQSQKSIQLIIA